MVAPAAKSGGPPAITRTDRPQGPRLDKAQVEKAVQALIRHHAKVLSEKSKGKAKDLLGDSWEYIHVQLTTVKIPERTTPKPIPISLPHPIYSTEDGFSMCIIVKEDCKAAVKKALQELKIDGAADVVGLQELRTDYKQYQDRRTLRDAFDMFLVDDRIMALLGRVLGQIFFRKKKQPVPIRLGALAKGDVKGAAQRIIDARNRTYMYRSPGVCTSVKAARTDFAIAKASENVYQCMLNMVEATPGKWRGVQSLCIKTPESVALPVYNAMPSYLRTTPNPDVNSDDEKEARKAKKEAKKGVEGDKASTEGKEEKGKKGVKRGRPGAEEEEAPKKIKASTEGAAAKKGAAAKAEPADGKRKRGSDAGKAADTPEGKGKKVAAEKPKASPADKPAAPKGKAASPAVVKKAEAAKPDKAASKKAETAAAGKKDAKAGKKKGK